MSETTVFARPLSLAPVTTHYCPGCTHGIIHRMVAEVIDKVTAIASGADTEVRHV